MGGVTKAREKGPSKKIIEERRKGWDIKIIIPPMLCTPNLE
jgi:hypothetical protein